ncbi:Acetamidase [Colletotrichum higginsianum]|uniref:Acetamidase n=1 Tax=Colletotrichum higginsianum TaxID=80884 RepID=A0A4T0VDW2_9PEZI|nr:Acetamidase [Colletotrichum higginsianum]
MPAAAKWEVIASRHRAKQQQAIPQAWTIPDSKLKELSGTGTGHEGRLIALNALGKSALLTEKELDISGNYTARELLDKIHGRDLSSEEVTLAFCKRAAVAQQLTSCLTEIFFHQGIARARQLDQHMIATGRPFGPLHGLPISLKDSFVIEGHHATVGYVEFLKRPPPTANSAMVDLLLDAGAVFFCKTNIPQTLMTADSENNIFGRTLNPHKTSLTAGGSTGGEGALISFRGSVLGIGTDIAGSIRIPSLCCGIYGFKPTADQLDTAHQLSEFLRLRSGYADSWRSTWRDNNLDVVVGPGAISTAVPHDTYGAPVYTLMWNVLDYPAGIIPYGVASKDKDFQYQKAITPFDADYDPEASDGAPCAIQVVAPRFRDEECLQAMRIIDRDIRQ